jgi:hypothetical protein
MRLSASAIEELPQPGHPSLRELHAYWLSKKGSLVAPPRSAIDPAEIVKLLPNICLIDVIGNPPLFRFRLFGTNLVAAYGRDLTGDFLNEIDMGALGPQIANEVTRVVQERRPQAVRITVTKQEDGRHLQYERIALPLSNDGQTVNMILCGFAIERAFTAGSALQALSVKPTKNEASKVVRLRPRPARGK